MFEQESANDDGQKPAGWDVSSHSGPEFSGWVKEWRPKREVEVIPRPADGRGFRVLPKRWVVERAFAWLVQHRQLVRDYEQSPRCATACIFIAMIRLMLRRLA